MGHPPDRLTHPATEESLVLDIKTGDRSQQMRIVVECARRPASGSDGLAEVLDGTMADWQVTSLLLDEDQLWLISGQVSERVGAPGYAKAAHTLVQRILDLGSVSRAEADLPVTLREHPGRPDGTASPGADECAPGSEVTRWARDVIRCEEAWAVPAAPGGRTRGAGVVIGHPDTGYTLHPNLGADALDLSKDRDFIDDDDDALDPLVPPGDSPWPLADPGHGTGTASVIAGRGPEQDGIVGVAPAATLVPIRAVESVVQLFDTDVARSVEHARATGCQIISISLGGKGFFGLQTAIQRAVDAGMIVLAAAGNQVGVVVAPASYPNCLAIAATGIDDQPWPESSRGSAVDVCAPGWCVWVAAYRWDDGEPVAEVRRASGTSYAVAHVAGVAALWLAHHGPEALRERYGGQVQAAFLQVLRGGARVPAGWNPALWGAGIVDAAAVLTAPLPPADVLAGATGRVAAPAAAYARLGAIVNLSDAEFEGVLARRFEIAGSDLHRAVSRFEGELAFHLLEQPAFRANLLGGPDDDGDTGLQAAHLTSSPEFAARFLQPPDAVEGQRPRL